MENRIQKLQKMLPQLSCDAFMVENSVNLYYLTGMNVSTGRLLVTAHDAFFLLDSRYFEMAKKRCAATVVSSESQTFAEFLKAPSFKSLQRLGFDAETTSYSTYEQLKETLCFLELVPCQNPVMQLRSIKGPEEIAALRQAAALGSEGFDYVCSLLKTGVSESELATELEIFWKRKGSKSLGFDPIIAFGANSSMPHYRAAARKLQEGDTVLIDIGVNLDHYHSDMTRVVFFGEANPAVANIYEVVLRAQLAALALCKPGARIGDIDAAARGLIEKEGFGSNFTHGLGHGVGLEIHEAPTIRNKAPYAEHVLKEGMVITIEPGIYLPDCGGVRIEDTIVITKEGYEDLTLRDKSLRVIDLISCDD